MTEPGSRRQDNAAYDGGTQNIAQGGNVYNLNVYPQAAGPTEPAEAGSGRRGIRALSARGRVLAAVGAAAVIAAVPATVLTLRHDTPLKTEKADEALPTPSSSPTPSPSPSPSASTPSTPSVAAAAAPQPPASPTPSATPTRRTATGSAAYPSQNVLCTTIWYSTAVPGIQFQPCTQAVSGTGGAQFGVKVQNTTTGQQVVTVLVHGYVTAVPKDCQGHRGAWREIVIDPGQTWYSDLAQCSLGNEVKGYRVQSGARVASGSASDAEVENSALHYAQGFDISTTGKATPAT
ncbi:hypothetical protein ACFVYT_25875 [Streptomyces sp. NPDC058290]|uniref:hypothetical protein n=1 Tax=Streptomyces sp. NPDC058290 TaxID=3346426 RepID=UPI0036E5B691